MGGGGQQTNHGEPHEGDAGVYTWEEVQKHNSKNDQWLVINRKVYNITQWAKRHPGGFQVIGHYAGEDATEAFTAFHPDLKFVQKFLKPLLIGELKATEPSQDHNKNAAIIQDFEILRAQAEKQGLFQAKPLFFCLYLGHILLLEALAWLIVWLWGTSWTLTFVCSVMLATAQAGWLQHDLGHLSVFKKSRWNHLMHKFVNGHLKGASANWWSNVHFQHHAKPNVLMKDDDIGMFDMVLLGATRPEEFGIKKIKYVPYNHQHIYFSLVVTPLAIPVIYINNIIIMIAHRHWVDLVWSMTYYFRYFYCSVPLYGLYGSLTLMIFFRVLESLWFMWVTQMNHVPMEVDYEKHQDWMTLQLKATCNIEQSSFNDWFTGHLNFQIEHHLFPRMPRHNYHLVAPQVRALCQKHGIPYEVKTLWRGMADIVRSLKTSGELWLDAYLHK